MENALATVQELVTTFGLKIIAAIVVLIVGKWVSKFLTNVSRKVMAKRNIDSTLVAFTSNLVYVALMVFVILAALGQLGIQTTSFIAVIGAAGLAIGLALQGSLANFAAGFLMIIFRPFKVGDYIEGGGVSGVVEEISIFTTQIKSPDNRTIIVPNSQMTAGAITNYSTKDTRRVDLTFGVAYDANIDKVKGVISETLGEDSRILKDPPPTIGLV